MIAVAVVRITSDAADTDALRGFQGFPDACGRSVRQVLIRALNATVASAAMNRLAAELALKDALALAVDFLLPANDRASEAIHTAEKKQSTAHAR